MKPSRRLPAFTPTEMLVVMLLSTTIFGAALLAFQIIGAQYKSYDEITSQTLRLDRLSAQLKRDFVLAQRADLDGSWLTCRFPTFDIYYQFEKEQILRSTNLVDTRTDTFKFAQATPTGYFDGQVVDFGLVDQFSVSLRLFDEESTLSCSKVYGRRMLMLNAIENGN